MRKRILSCILVLCMVFSLLPLSAFADNSKATNESTVDVGGTTSVGKMISNEISAQNAESAQEESNISDLVVEGNTATVTFMTNAAECDIVVGIYDENDETRMLASGTASAFSGDGKVTVDLVGEIPEAFVATAYMLESTSHSPLCKAYTTQMYTTEMQAFLATTVSDYDEDLVLNLDESEETNFAVFNTGTLRADESGGMSVEDKGNGTYIVTNADAGVKSLAKGDEFAFTYDDGTVLLVSVATVNVDGDTVTITEATDAELQDFFDYVKIEGTNDSSSQATIDTSVADEGVTLVEEQPAVQSRARAKSIDKEGSYGSSFSVNLEKDKVKGSLAFEYEIAVKVYINDNYRYISLTAESTLKLSVSYTAFKGEKEKTINLPSVEVYLVAGVYARLRPAFVCEATVSVKWTGSVKATIGFAYDSDSGFVNKSSSPSCDSKLELSGKIFAGLKLSLDAVIISDKIASAGLETKVGAEITAKERLDEDTSSSKRHDCDRCLEGEISFVSSMTVKAKLLIFKFEDKFAEIKIKITDFYISSTFDDYGWTTCPHISYRVTATVLDQNGNKVATAPIECDGLNYCPITDSNGVATFYLPNGEYTLDVKSGTQSASKKITIHNNEKIVIINLSTGSQAADDPQISDSGKCGDNLTWKLDNSGTLTISGTGDMYIYDSSENADGVYVTTAPWGKYCESIKNVVIKNGVTSIGDYAFFGCSSLTSVTIPNSVTSIGWDAFYRCSSLTSVTIPNSVTSISGYAFCDCTSLTSVTIPDSVTSIGDSVFLDCISLESITVASDNINYSSQDGVLFNKDKTYLIQYPVGNARTSYSIPDSVTSISVGAFECCSSLTSVTIGNSVTSIGYWAFDDCSKIKDVYYTGDVSSWLGISFGGSDSNPCCYGANLYFGGELATDVVIPEGVTSIGDYAFYDCSSLTSITIPDSVTSIGRSAFEYCSSLTSVTIPNGVTSISEDAFCDCSSLTSVTIPNSVTSIGWCAFEYCSSLTSVTIPNSVTSIGWCAFRECSSLTSITIPDSVTSIGDGAFECCSSLTSVTIPDGVTSIGDSSFYCCTSLTSVTIPDSVTSIDEDAFYGCDELTDVYYSGSKTQWSKIRIGYRNECLINANIHFDGDEEDGGGDVPWASYSNLRQYSVEKAKTASVEKPSKKSAAAFSAKKTKAVEAGVKTRSFTGLKPEAEYVFIVVRNPKAEDYFASDNLCYIAQKQSDASGSVSFAYYSAAESVSEGVYVLHAHSYADGVCTICGIVDPNYEPPHEHSFSAWTQTKAPTCTAKGTESRSCTCGETETREVAALGHNYQNGVCTRCGAKNPNYIAAPTLKITTSSGKPKISWNAVDGATKYYIYRSTDGKNFKYYDSTTKTSYTNNSTTVGTTYYYKIKAVKVVDGQNVVSDFSNTRYIKCALAAPTLSIATSSGKPKISWNAVDGATKYWVYRSTDGKNFKYYDKTTKTSYTNSSTTIGTTYYYKVKAVKTVNGKDIASDYSTTKSIKCAPAAPTVSISRVNGKPKLSWKAVSGATKYWIYRSTDGKNFKYYDMTTKTSYTNSGAASGTKYYYKVKAVAVVNGNNVASAYSYAKSLVCTPATPNVSITSVSGKPKLSWNAVNGADKYWIYRSTDGKNFKYYDSTTKTTYTNNSTTVGTRYYYKVKAVVVDNGTSYASAFSNSKSLVCTPATPNVSITSVSGKPKLSWNAVNGATKYWIYRSTDGKNFKYYDSTTKTTYTNNSTTVGTRYYYKVKAVVVDNGTSYASAFSSSKSLLVSTAAPIVKTAAAEGTPSLSWNAVNGADKYWIYRSTDGKNFKYYDSTTKTTYTNKSVTAGTTYYYKVKAVKVVNGSSIASQFSNSVSVKAK